MLLHKRRTSEVEKDHVETKIFLGKIVAFLRIMTEKVARPFLKNTIEICNGDFNEKIA